MWAKQTSLTKVSKKSRNYCQSVISINHKPLDDVDMNYKGKTRDELADENARLRKQISVLEDEVALLNKQKGIFFTNKEAARSIFVTTSDYFILKDINGKFVAANPAVCRFLNRSEEEIIGKTDCELFPPEEAEMYMRDDAKVIRECRSMIQEEEVTGDKGKRWMQVSKEPVFDDAGVVTGVLCSVRDITSWKTSEKELHKRLVELESIKTLSGTIPICAGCHDIRDNKGDWHSIENYVRQHTEAEFSHGICPKCTHDLYPGFGDFNR